MVMSTSGRALSSLPVWHDGNGYSEDEVTEEGCAQLSIQAMQDGIFGRGIVMTFPGCEVWTGWKWHAITPEWLDDWERRTESRSFSRYCADSNWTLGAQSSVWS